jgi:hypothetical protein
MIYRTYQCNDCETIYECSHDSGDDPAPDCPTCSKVLQWTPKSFAITGVKSKAIDLAQDVLEKDFGLSNFKDNNREGDVGIVRYKETKQETELVEREVREMVAQSTNPAVKEAFWGGNAGATPQMNSMTGQSLIQMAKVGPAAVDPMALLHKGAKEGKIPTLNQMTTQLRTRDQ